MDLMLQIWGGLFYLLNKVFLALAEGKPPKLKRRLRIMGWSVYILGVPAWSIIFIGNHSWIAASLEVACLPTMCLGLYNVVKAASKPNKTLVRVVTCLTYSFLFSGVSYSLYDFGGIQEFSQLLELIIVFSFFVGGDLLAKENINGWIFFMLMITSTSILMLIQHKPLLVLQQLTSLCFVIYGFIFALRESRVKCRNMGRVEV